MRRRLLLLSMLALFGVTYATTGQLPRSAIAVLRGGAEHVARLDRPDGAFA